jgi:hypothetical protein
MARPSFVFSQGMDGWGLITPSHPCFEMAMSVVHDPVTLLLSYVTLT